MKERSSFVFYESFYEACQYLDAKSYRSVMDAIIEYGLYGREPDLAGPLQAIFLMATPAIDQAKKRRSTAVQNGRSGGRPSNRNQLETNRKPIAKPTENLNVDVDVNVDVNDDVNVNADGDVNDDVNVNADGDVNGDVKPPADTHLPERKEIIDYFNKKAGTNYKPTSTKTKELINARINDGFTVEDFKKVIDKKCRSWLNDKKMQYYLRPETLFSPGHFESYLNEIQPEPAVINPDGFEELWDSMTSR